MGHNKAFLGDGADSGVMSISQVPAAGGPGRGEARTGVGRSPVSALGIVILAALMTAVSMLSLYGLWRFWPVPPPATGPAPVTGKFSYFNWHVTLTQDQQFFAVVALGGVIGSMLHGLRSLSRYIGERFLFRSWIPYYILLPLVGSLLATIVYLALRGGLLPGATSSSQPDPYGITAISALVGMFSAQAAEKLEAIFDLLFTKAMPAGQSVTDVTLPTLPTIAGFDPPQAPAGTSIVISGANLKLVTGVSFAGPGADEVPFHADSKERLTVTVPGDAATGPITLRVGAEAVTSTEVFTVT
jgi:hypothetical protein